MDFYNEKVVYDQEIAYVSIISVFSALDFEAGWDGTDSTGYLKAGRKEVTVKEGSEIGTLNGFEITLEAPVKKFDGEYCVPVTMLTDIFNLNVTVNKEEGIVTFSKQKDKSFDRTDKLIFFNENLMDETKADIKNGDKFFMDALSDLLKETHEFMAQPIDSVVNKTMLPPSGNKHDYLSTAPYFWPDPESETGYPWKPKDGQLNPKSRGKDTDQVRTSNMFIEMEDLCIAYYYTDDKTYLEKALKLIKSWFINEDTRMNPYIKYGQSVPGGIEGRPLGVIEWTAVCNIVTALQLLERNNMIEQNDLDVMNDWFTAYISWLRRSRLGIDEDEQRNNHGSNYDYQLTGILLYLDMKDEAVKRFELAKTIRIADYIQPDGSQPFELRRTKSMNYTTMNLRVLTKVADLAMRFSDVDLWNYETEDGRGLKKAYEFLKPYILGEKEWQWQQIQETVDIKLANTMRPLFMTAKSLFGDEFLDFPDDLEISVSVYDALRLHMKSEKSNKEIRWKMHQI